MRVVLGVYWGYILVIFGVILGVYCGYVGVILGVHWDHIGVISGSWGICWGLFRENGKEHGNYSSEGLGVGKGMLSMG